MNPPLNTSECEAQFDFEEVEACTANMIAELICAEVDDDGHTKFMLLELVDHKKDGTAVSESKAHVFKNGVQRRQQTTQGWKLSAEWKDNTTTWQTLEDLKELHPVLVAECAVANGIDHEPAFTWWVHETLKKRDRTTSAVKRRHFHRHQKCGTELPKTAKRALKIDNETNTTFW